MPRWNWIVLKVMASAPRVDTAQAIGQVARQKSDLRQLTNQDTK
jgi:hypothetical protein